jgi:hypothetical protein
MRRRPDGLTVVTLPAEIEHDSARLTLDGTDSVVDGAGPACAALREAVASGAPVVVADLTATTFCDYPGFHQLVVINHLAAISDVQLRLAVPADGAVRRWLEFLAQHRLVLAYPGLSAATTALPASALVMLSTSLAATSRSFTLVFCDSLASTAKACWASMRWVAIRMPRAWLMTARESRAWLSWMARSRACAYRRVLAMAAAAAVA